MGNIKYDSDVCNKIISNLKEMSNSVNNIVNSMKSDFSALSGLNLLSGQISAVCQGAKNISISCENLSSLISQNINSWLNVKTEINNNIRNYNNSIVSGGKNRRDNPKEKEKEKDKEKTKEKEKEKEKEKTKEKEKEKEKEKKETEIEDVEKGKKISLNEVKEIINKLDSSVYPLLLQKINKELNGENLLELLTNSEKSNILVNILRKILQDTSGENTELSLYTEEIQSLLLEKLNTSKIDLTTEEGRQSFEKYLLKQLKKDVDESKWMELLYGNKVVKLNILDGDWIVANTKQDVKSYASYAWSSGVRQNANVNEWGSSCLAFAETHSYDLYNGTKTSGAEAAGYAHATSFTTYIDDDKQKVLSKVYDEIVNGRPVVIQVNGNKEGNVRHFVTVVGFKEGVTSAEDLKETDLLIMDSWDGKIERMDTNTSRFMTSGKDCGKNYSGYYLRVFKS